MDKLEWLPWEEIDPPKRGHEFENVEPGTMLRFKQGSFLKEAMVGDVNAQMGWCDCCSSRYDYVVAIRKVKHGD